MRPKVNLADVVVAQHRGISGVGGIVSSTVVDGAASGEGQSRLQPVLLDESPGAVLQPLAASHKENISYFLPEGIAKAIPQWRRMKPLPPISQLHLTRCQSWSCQV